MCIHIWTKIVYVHIYICVYIYTYIYVYTYTYVYVLIYVCVCIFIYSYGRGGTGKATTGKAVDGRPTVPGLHTDCIPGVLSSDCSPQQEDGAWSVEAEHFLDSRTGGTHSKGMAAIQSDIDAGYAARDKFLADCLQDASICTGRRTDDSTAARMAGNYGDAPTWGNRAHPWAPEQGADYGQYNNDGHWNHIALPSGAKGDGTIVSDSYYADALDN